MSKLTQYGHAFQIKALAILITDRDFLQQISDIISPDYFDNDAGKWIIRKLISQPINLLSSNKFNTMYTDDQMGNAIDIPDIWLKQHFTRLNSYAKATHE